MNILTRVKQLFNYRLSRVRRIVENAFGILAQGFRLFNRRIPLIPDNVDRVVKATCVLHNFLTEKKELPAIYNRLNPDGDPYLTDDGAIIDIGNLHGYHSSAQSRAVRDIYNNYFNQDIGAVQWQEREIFLT